MVSFDMRPAIPLDRTAPVARWSWCWPALLISVTLALDALWPLMPGAWGHGVLWIDLGALACLVWATTGPRRARRSDWATSIDGRVLSGLVLAVLHVVRLQGAFLPVQWLHQIAAGGVCFYALTARLRRDPAAADALWPTFALLVLSLSLLTLGPLTQGLDAFAAQVRLVDQRWVSQFGLGKTLTLATVLCAGRASEPGARAFWRVTALVGGVASLVNLLVTGPGLAVSSLGNLDEPFYFGTSIVAFMLLAGMAHQAWQLAGERPEQAGRWRASAVGFALIVLMLVFGGTTGGEGVRAVAALAAAAVISARLMPHAAAARTPRAQSAAPAAPVRSESPASRAAQSQCQS